jgi:hypothetical protein
MDDAVSMVAISEIDQADLVMQGIERTGPDAKYDGAISARRFAVEIFGELLEVVDAVLLLNAGLDRKREIHGRLGPAAAERIRLIEIHHRPIGNLFVDQLDPAVVN